MPLGGDVIYRYKPGTKIRLALRKIKGKRKRQVVEAKNMKSGKIHTEAEFKADRKKRSGKQRLLSKIRQLQAKRK